MTQKRLFESLLNQFGVTFWPASESDFRVTLVVLGFGALWLEMSISKTDICPIFHFRPLYRVPGVDLAQLGAPPHFQPY